MAPLLSRFERTLFRLVATTFALLSSAAAQDTRATIPGFRFVSSTEPFSGAVRRAVLSPDARRVLTLGRDGRVVLADESGRVFASVEADASAQGLLAFSADGALAAYLGRRPDGDSAAAAPAMVVVHAASGRRVGPWRSVRLRGRAYPGIPEDDAEFAYGPAGEVVFHSARDGVLLIASSTSRLAAPAASGAKVSVSADGTRLGRVVAADVVYGGRRRRRAALRVFEVADGATRVDHLHEDDAPERDPGFPASIALDPATEEFVVLENGAARRRSAARPETPSAALRDSVTAVGVGRGGFLLTTRDGALETWSAAGRIARRTSGLPAPARFVVSGDAATLRSGASAALLRPGLPPLLLEDVAEAGVADGIAYARDAEGGLALYGEGAPSRVRVDRPEYDDADERCVRVDAARGRLIALVGGRLAWFDARGALAATNAPAHREALADARFIGDALWWHAADGRAARADPATGTVREMFDERTVVAGGVAFRARDFSAPDDRPTNDLSTVDRVGVMVAAAERPVAAARTDAGVVVLYGDRPRLRTTIPDAASLHAPLAVSDDGARVARVLRARDGNDRLESLAADTGRPVFATELGGPVRCEGLRYAPGARILAAQLGGPILGAPSDGAAYFDESGVLLARDPAGPGIARGAGGFGPAAFSDDGRFGAVARFDGAITVREFGPKPSRRVFAAPREALSHFADVRTLPATGCFAVHFTHARRLVVASFADGSAPASVETAAGPHAACAPLGPTSLLVVEPQGIALRTLPGLELRALLPGRFDGVAAAADGSRFVALRRGAGLLFVRAP